jgi:hypothetical protein
LSRTSSAGPEHAEHDGDRVARGGPVQGTGAECGGDLRGHVRVRGDAGERHEVHDALLGPAADGVREPGLAETAGSYDGDGARGTEQPFDRRDVLVPAEQRIRLVRHTVPGHRGLTAQQLLLYGLESGARVGAEFVAQFTAVRLVPGQRGGRAGRRRLAAQQLTEHLLVARMRHGCRGERSGGLPVPSEAGERERLRADEYVVDGGTFGAQRGHRVVGVTALVGGPFPEG